MKGLEVIGKKPIRVLGSVMVQSVIIAFVLIVAFGADPVAAQQSVQYKNFVYFAEPVPGIDFFASNQKEIAPYEKPLTASMGRLEMLFGKNMPKGAIFICSTIEQRDAVYEPKILKMGYGWTLTLTTAGARAQQMLERIKAQMGDEIPAEILERFKNRPPEMNAEAEKQAASTLMRQVAYAILQTMLNKDLRYRSSRIDDMGKSPLPDWLDIGIASYAAGDYIYASYLQEHMEESFPIEDILTMSRPFVASSYGQSSGGGGGMMGRSGGAQGGTPPNFGGDQGAPPAGFSGRGQGGSSGGGGQRGNFQRTIPKDEQDRMLFDGQSSTFFCYLMDKIGIEKVKELIRKVQEGTEGRELLAQPELLGPDFGEIEKDWIEWVKALKT